MLPAADGTGGDNAFGKRFFLLRSIVLWEFRNCRAGSVCWLTLDQPPAPSPSPPVSAGAAMLEVQGFLFFPLPAPWDKQTRLCLLSPLPLSGRKVPRMALDVSLGVGNLV